MGIKASRVRYVHCVVGLRIHVVGVTWCVLVWLTGGRLVNLYLHRYVYFSGEGFGGIATWSFPVARRVYCVNAGVLREGQLFGVHVHPFFGSFSS